MRAGGVSSFAPVIRVFVIEDTPQMRELLEQMLTLDDLAVVGSAANGASALPELNDANPDVVGSRIPDRGPDQRQQRDQHDQPRRERGHHRFHPGPSFHHNLLPAKFIGR